MSNLPAVVRSKKLETQLKSEVITRDEIEIFYQDKSNYWDQLRALLNEQGWTTHDRATLNLVSEIPNSHAFFAVRKIDNLVIGAINFIDTPNFVYGNCYVIRKEFRAAGVGSELIRRMLRHLAHQLHFKGFVSRAGKAVYKVYVNWPMNAIYLYNVWCLKFHGIEDLKEIFPNNGAQPYLQVSMKDVLKNPGMKSAVEKYDEFVTSQNRADFLKNYYSIDFVEELVIFDIEGNVKGMAGIVPTGNTDGHYKMNPVYASCHEDAGNNFLNICKRFQ